MSDVAHEAAAGLVQDFVDTAVEADESSSSTEGAVAEPQHEAADDLDPELPEDLAAYLTEPDFEAEAEIEAEAEEYVPGEYEDPAVGEERKKRIAAEKKARFLEDQMLNDKRQKWRADIEKYAPYVPPDETERILKESSSRRAAFVKAKRLNDSIKANPRIQALAARVSQDEDAVLARAVEIARGEVREAWGTPLESSANAAPTEAIVREEQSKRVDNARTLQERIRARIQGNDGSLAERIWKD